MSSKELTVPEAQPVELKLAFIGFGGVARAFARMIAERESNLELEYGLRCRTTAIATANHGCITSTTRIDLVTAALCVERGANLPEIPNSVSHSDPISLINNCDADILIEVTPLNAIDGEPATTHIRTALERGLHVVTANKGPIAFAYSNLKALAAGAGLGFHFEGTVMDGAPVFNLVQTCLPGIRVLGFSGILNSTSNLILSGMESGHSFDESLADAQRRGIAEANADHDIDGWDAAVKTVALANVLMDADARPADVARQGIRNVSAEDLRDAARSGLAVRLVARGKMSAGGIDLTVAPELVSLSSPLGCVRGTTNVLIIETDLMGEIAIVEDEPGIDQTAYALLSDLIRIRQHL